MFADDTKIFREIKTLGDASSLQKDLGKLVTWSQSSRLLFNEAKYKEQFIGVTEGAVHWSDRN